MRIRLCDRLTHDSSDEIAEAVRRLLRDCGISGPPTPLEDLLNYRRLSRTIRPKDLVSTVARRAGDAAKKFWQRLKQKVAGILDLQSRHVLVNPQLHPRRQEFVAFHELGHDVLAWHREIFVVTSEADLLPSAREVFNAEANDFAAKAIFQLDHLAQHQRGIRLAMTELAGLAAQYGASLTATARHYVGVQDIPVALVVGRRYAKGDMFGIAFRYGVGNEAFLREFDSGVMGWGFPPEAPSCATINLHAVDYIEDRLVVADLRSERRELIVDTMFNGYETLTLVHPVPVRRPRKTAGSPLRSLLARARVRRR